MFQSDAHLNSIKICLLKLSINFVWGLLTFWDPLLKVF